MAEWLTSLVRLLTSYEFYYPLFMAFLWMIGALYYYVHWERPLRDKFHDPAPLTEYPGISFIVPCHNEGDNVVETIEFLLRQNYPDFEIITINDGSHDNTGALIDELAVRHERVRAVHLANNQGKAMALRMGALVSNHEFLICIDGDTLLDENAATWIMRHFIMGSRVGAVTGNPRVRTRSTLLGKIQVGEFSSIVGMIKRAQRIYGRVFTVSGVVAAFRKSALHQVGYWSTDMVTEDIDVSWNLQLHHWDIRFEPNALCWILMPETLGGLWRQRLRWAQGGMEVLLKYLPDIREWRKRRMWPVYIEFITSAVWAYFMALIVILWSLDQVMELSSATGELTLVPGWGGVILATVCMFQFALSMVIDSRFERGLGKVYYWMIWYPVIYWFINVMVTVVALPRALMRRRGVRATWVSPDRGIHP